MLRIFKKSIIWNKKKKKKNIAFVNFAQIWISCFWSEENKCVLHTYSNSYVQFIVLYWIVMLYGMLVFKCLISFLRRFYVYHDYELYVIVLPNTFIQVQVMLCHICHCCNNQSMYYTSKKWIDKKEV